MGDCYRFDAAESKYGNEIVPSLSREEPFNSKNTFLVKHISGTADLVGQITASVFSQHFVSEELQH